MISLPAIESALIEALGAEAEDGPFLAYSPPATPSVPNCALHDPGRCSARK